MKWSFLSSQAQQQVTGVERWPVVFAEAINKLTAAQHEVNVKSVSTELRLHYYLNSTQGGIATEEIEDAVQKHLHPVQNPWYSRQTEQCVCIHEDVAACVPYMSDISGVTQRKAP